MLKGLLSPGEFESDSEGGTSEEELKKCVEETKQGLKRKSMKIAEHVAKCIADAANDDEVNSSKKSKKLCGTIMNDVRVSGLGCQGTTTNLNMEAIKKNSNPNCSQVDSDLFLLKEKLESQIEKVISKGDVEKADLLNDQLMTVEVKSQLKQAAAAQDFVAKQEKRLKERVKKRRKKLNWTFETKQRWETKSNM